MRRSNKILGLISLFVIRFSTNNIEVFNFLDLPYNEKKKNPPPTPATLLNRWWFKDYERKRKQRPHKDWPDLIDFPGLKYGAKVAWLGGRIENWNPEDF